MPVHDCQLFPEALPETGSGSVSGNCLQYEAVLVVSDRARYRDGVGGCHGNQAGGLGGEHAGRRSGMVFGEYSFAGGERNPETLVNVAAPDGVGAGHRRFQ